MSESVSGRVALQAAWQGLGGLLAAAAGAATALVALLRGVPLDVACLRAGGVLLGALLLTRAGSFALARLWSAPAHPRPERRDA